MKFKDLLFPLSFVFLIAAWGLNYFFVKKEAASDVVQAGQMVQGSQKTGHMLQPLEREVLFADEAKVECRSKSVETGYEIARFSTCGAGIDELTFKRMISGKERLITALFEPAEYERDRHGFLVALNEKTPYYYELVDEQKNENNTVLIYRAQTSQAQVTKTFTVYNDTYKIDLALTIEPKNDTVIQARVFLPGPVIAKALQRETVMGIVYTDKKSILKTKPADLDTPRWASPTLFGIEDRYFVNALIADPEHFVQRAYYAAEGSESLVSIFEGPSIKEKTTWNLSFYCGPKEAAAFAKVDSRLEETLDYGWFSFLSKFFLYLLNFLYKYVKNYGWAIVLLTMALRLILVPFTLGGDKIARNAAELKKKMAYIEQKYKHDREAFEREKMALYNKHGMPGLASCLPLFLQVPMFLALQRLLSNSIDLYQAPFLWISDLSATDPYYIFPAIFGISMIMQALFSPGTIRERFVTFFIAVVVGGFISNFSAGVTLFMAVSTLFGVIQTKLQRTLA